MIRIKNGVLISVNEEDVINGHFDIPYGVTTIGFHALAYIQLNSVTIPESVTTIEGLAFSGNKLENVIIPDSVRAIGNYAFYNNKLKEIIIPEGVTIIGEEAFNYNQLTSVIIPESVIENDKDNLDMFFRTKFYDNIYPNKVTIKKGKSNVSKTLENKTESETINNMYSSVRSTPIYLSTEPVLKETPKQELSTKILPVYDDDRMFDMDNFEESLRELINSENATVFTGVSLEDDMSGLMAMMSMTENDSIADRILSEKKPMKSTGATGTIIFGDTERLKSDSEYFASFVESAKKFKLDEDFLISHFGNSLQESTLKNR